MDGVTILNAYMTYSDGWAAILTAGVYFGLLLFIAAIHVFSDGEILIGFMFPRQSVTRILKNLKTSILTVWRLILNEWL